MRKWITRILLVLLLLFAVFVAGTFWFIRKNYSPEKLKLTLEETFSRKTGFQVSIQSLEFTWSGDVRLRSVCIRNPLLTSPRCVLGATITSLDLRILPLFRKKVEIRSAHLDEVELNLFAEKSSDAKGKPRLNRSWDLPPAEATLPAGSPGAGLKLDSIRLSRGIVRHEHKVLPLPVGDTRFSAELGAGDTKRAELKLEYPDKGQLSLRSRVRTANPVKSLRSFLGDGLFIADDTAEGEAEVNRFNASVIDTRLGAITGKLGFNLAQNRITISTEKASLGIQHPLHISMDYAGKFMVHLPTLDIQDGSGRLTAPGIAVEYKNLARSQATGLGADIGAAVDLGAGRGMGVPAAMAAQVVLQGRLQKTGFSGAIQAKNFSYALAPDLAVTAAAFAGNLADSTLNLKDQTFHVANQAIRISGWVKPRELSLAAEAEKLNYRSWQVEKFRGNIRRAATSIRVENATMQFFRGRLSGSYTLDTETRRQNFKITVAGVRAQDLSQGLGLQSTVFGELSGDAAFSCDGFSAGEIRQSLTGNLHLRLGRGKIRDSFLQRGVFPGPLHKLEEKFHDIEFVSADAEVNLDRGAVRARRIYFDAEEWNFALRLEADSAWNGKAALTFRFRPSFMENVANPLHLGIEGRKEGEFYELPFACRGHVLSGSCYKQNW